MSDSSVPGGGSPHGQWEVPAPDVPSYDGPPQYGARQLGSPQNYGTPQYGTPQYGTPQYGTPQYGTPQYGAPQYGAPQYGAPQYGAPQYGAPQYGAYPTPGSAWPGGPRRPGQIMSASVLSYIQAGLLILSGLTLLAGASAVHDASSAFSSSDGGLTAEFVFDGILNLVAAGLFIAGGVMFTGGTARGRTYIGVSAAITVCLSIYWMIRTQDGGVIVWAVIFAAMPIIATCLAFGRPATDWLKTRPQR